MAFHRIILLSAGLIVANGIFLKREILGRQLATDPPVELTRSSGETPIPPLPPNGPPANNPVSQISLEPQKPTVSVTPSTPTPGSQPLSRSSGEPPITPDFPKTEASTEPAQLQTAQESSGQAGGSSTPCLSTECSHSNTQPADLSRLPPYVQRQYMPYAMRMKDTPTSDYPTESPPFYPTPSSSPESSTVPQSSASKTEEEPCPPFPTNYQSDYSASSIPAPPSTKSDYSSASMSQTHPRASSSKESSTAPTTGSSGSGMPGSSHSDNHSTSSSSSSTASDDFASEKPPPASSSSSEHPGPANAEQVPCPSLPTNYPTDESTSSKMADGTSSVSAETNYASQTSESAHTNKSDHTPEESLPVPTSSSSSSTAEQSQSSVPCPPFPTNYPTDENAASKTASDATSSESSKSDYETPSSSADTHKSEYTSEESSPSSSSSSTAEQSQAPLPCPPLPYKYPTGSTDFRNRSNYVPAEAQSTSSSDKSSESESNSQQTPCPSLPYPYPTGPASSQEASTIPSISNNATSVPSSSKDYASSFLSKTSPYVPIEGNGEADKSQHADLNIKDQQKHQCTEESCPSAPLSNPWKDPQSDTMSGSSSEHSEAAHVMDKPSEADTVAVSTSSTDALTEQESSKKDKPPCPSHSQKHSESESSMHEADNASPAQPGPSSERTPPAWFRNQYAPYASRFGSSHHDKPSSPIAPSDYNTTQSEPVLLTPPPTQSESSDYSTESKEIPSVVHTQSSSSQTLDQPHELSEYASDFTETPPEKQTRSVSTQTTDLSEHSKQLSHTETGAADPKASSSESSDYSAEPEEKADKAKESPSAADSKASSSGTSDYSVESEKSKQAVSSSTQTLDQSERSKQSSSTESGGAKDNSNSTPNSSEPLFYSSESKSLAFKHHTAQDDADMISIPFKNPSGSSGLVFESSSKESAGASVGFKDLLIEPEPDTTEKLATSFMTSNKSVESKHSIDFKSFDDPDETMII